MDYMGTFWKKISRFKQKQINMDSFQFSFKVWFQYISEKQSNFIFLEFWTYLTFSKLIKQNANDLT